MRTEWTPEQIGVSDLDRRVAGVLRLNNPAEPGGDWSDYDVAAYLERQQNGTEVVPPSELYAVREAFGRLPVIARFVGGTSRFLYRL